jgi:hypothetical protein
MGAVCPIADPGHVAALYFHGDAVVMSETPNAISVRLVLITTACLRSVVVPSAD